MAHMQTTSDDHSGGRAQAPAGGLTGPERLHRALGAGLYVAVVALAYLWPSTPGGGVTVCPFRRIFGLSCFGCGMTRGWTAMLHGDWYASVTYHPFAPVLLVGLGLWALRASLEAVRGRRLDLSVIPGWNRVEKPALVGALVFVVVFGLIRVSLELLGVLQPV